MTRFALSAEAPWWELWRLWTCHLVHYSATHLALNALAALPPVVVGVRWRQPPLLHPRAAASAAALLYLIAAPLISLAILIIAKPVEYRGASAMVMGLWFLGRGRAGLALIALATLKLLVETVHPFGDALPLAHWLGAAAGVIGAFILRRCSPSSS